MGSLGAISVLVQSIVVFTLGCCPGVLIRCEEPFGNLKVHPLDMASLRLSKYASDHL